MPANQALPAKDQTIPATVQAHYAEIDRLGQEKEKLAERVVQLVLRARARLDFDLNKILTLQGEPDLPVSQSSYYASLPPKNPVVQLNESLRSAISMGELPSTPVSSGLPPQKSASYVSLIALCFFRYAF